MDGLEAEREQGITIDVAYRFFSTPRRSFIVADTPGHEQYTRNMATGASGSDVAVILIDARKGVLTQTRRHSYICSLLGIRHVCVAVNKIDLVEYFGRALPSHRRRLPRVRPVAGLWLHHCHSRVGPLRRQRHATLGTHGLVRGPDAAASIWKSVEVDAALESKPFRFPVQWVNRANQDFRGYCGHGGLRHRFVPASASWWRSPAANRAVARIVTCGWRSARRASRVMP